jgi:hypothetical protein
MNKCDICRSEKGVAVRFGRNSIHTMCGNCIDEVNRYATNQEMIFMVTHIPMIRKGKCNEGVKFTNDCCVRIATFIWLRSFKDWITQKRRLK